MIMGDFNITLSQIDIFRKQNKTKKDIENLKTINK